MKVGVTAATGNLGCLLLDKLAEQIGAENVTGIARQPGKISADNIERRAGDYENASDWEAALQGLDTAILISAPTDPEGIKDRVEMHRNVIAGARKAGLRKLLYTSVIGNGKEIDTLYAPVAAVNRQTEKDLQASGLDWVITRNGLYLEFDVAHILKSAAGDNVFRNNGGEGRCGYITRDEIATATVQLTLDDKHNGRIFNLIGGCHTQTELVKMVNEVHGKNVSYEMISDDECFTKLAPERGEAVANMLTGCYQCIRNGAFEVQSDFADAVGRPAKSVLQQITELAAC
ncbi:MAG: NAD(P)H-binding protein [Gammaproteobacteria bacterium]